MDILSRINREDRCTVIVSLHQVDMALKYCARVVALYEGRVVFDGPSRSLTPGLLRELYGVHADEILADAVRPAAEPLLVPAPVPALTPSPAWSASLSPAI
jgi:phosphonate transport system ATP-binding protein